MCNLFIHSCFQHKVRYYQVIPGLLLGNAKSSGPSFQVKEHWWTPRSEAEVITRRLSPMICLPLLVDLDARGHCKRVNRIHYFGVLGLCRIGEKLADRFITGKGRLGSDFRLPLWWSESSVLVAISDLNFTPTKTETVANFERKI